MVKARDTILFDDIITAKFAFDIEGSKEVCCVVSGFAYASFEHISTARSLVCKTMLNLCQIVHTHIPATCSPACGKDEENGIDLADFLKKPLDRRYDLQSYDDLLEACQVRRDCKRGGAYHA